MPDPEVPPPPSSIPPPNLWPGPDARSDARSGGASPALRPAPLLTCSRDPTPNPMPDPEFLWLPTALSKEEVAAAKDDM
ncbi:UNVERIFIED_CONTAM: hypothetical protein K2H54_002861 [Gekko kuhli]